jgi:hypothetical protein
VERTGLEGLVAMSKRMTKDELQESMGAFKPAGHAVIALENDEVAGQARKALVDAGVDEQDILTFTSAELFPDLKDMMRNASGASGFGYEIVLMRRYMTIASEGAGWLVVYAPEEAITAKVAEVAKRLNAKTAVRYGDFMHEDLV